jgi:D-hydroxyproline dehydrogenase subunit beta
MKTHDADIIIVGAGIIGLAHAYHAAKSGKKVLVLERHLLAGGASIANFGMLWPIGQTAGKMLHMALESRKHWLEVLETSGIPYKDTGSLYIASREDEANVGKEFAKLGPSHGYECEWLDHDAAIKLSPGLKPEAVLGALWSGTEATVDPRETLRLLPEFLQTRFGVQFQWGCPVFSVEGTEVRTAKGTWQAGRVIICSGSDFETLYPDIFAMSGLTRCRLQMLRTKAQPDGWDLGPSLAGGLTFRFYPSFHICQSLAALRQRIAEETLEYDRFGIHTMVSQSSSGELTFGDSHEYNLTPSPFSREEIDNLILRHLETFVRVPDFSIAERWYGVYAKHFEKSYVRFHPEKNIEVITGLGGAGMTLSFGVAAETFGLLPTETIQA